MKLSGEPPAKPWRFSTEILDVEDRRNAWCDAMERVCLPVSRSENSSDFRGELSCLISPLGMEFALIEGDAEEISGRYPDQPQAVWIGVLLAGEAWLTNEGEDVRLRVGDIIYGPTDVNARLRFGGPFRQIFVKVPQVAINPRLIAPLTPGLDICQVIRESPMFFQPCSGARQRCWKS